MVLLEYNVTGDAMIAALQVLAILVRKDLPLSSVAHAYQEMPESHRKVPLEGRAKPAPEQLAAVAAGAEAELNGSGRVVIRLSGTEPVVRIMVQHQELRKAEAWSKTLAERVAAL
jgi:phosphoglucosamine mutase